MPIKYRKILREQGLSQKQVSAATGIHQSQISGIVKGTVNPTLLTLKKLCVYHAVTPNDILEFEKWKIRR